MENKYNQPQELSQRDLLKFKRIIPVPFQIQLLDYSEPLICEEIIRILPGKRLVAFGTWREKRIVAKLFFGSKKIKQYASRDVKGIQALAESGILTPEIHFQGCSKNRDIQILIFERIEKAQPASEKVLKALALELATLHVSGILQHDLHFNNFLLKDDKIFMLDGGAIEKQNTPLDKEQSLNNFALLLSQVGINAKTIYKDLIDIYAESRGWKVKESDIIFLEKSITYWQSKRWKEFQKKINKECTAFCRLKTWIKTAVVVREFQGQDVSAFINNPEIVFTEKNQLLKNGRSSTVIKTNLNEIPVVVKRYNIKNIWHGLRRCFRKTRAARSWQLSQYLSFIGIPTAKPLAFVEKQFLGFRGKSYFLMEEVKGMHLGEFFTQASVTFEDKKKIAKKIILLFTNLAQLRLSHGDLKMTNILIHNDQPVIIDLDGMKQHRFRLGFYKKFQNDIKRFMKNWDNQPEIAKLFRVLDKYSAPL